MENSLLPPLAAGTASLPRRAIALVLDVCFADLLILPLTLSVGGAWRIALACAISTLYFVPQLAVSGKTLASRVLKVQVCRPDGRVPGWGRAGLRWVAWFGPIFVGLGLAEEWGLVLALLLIYGPALFDPRRRSVFDRISGLQVEAVVPS